jgi:hypothetical protein
VHVPISLATEHRNRVSPESPLWRDVIETTGQRRLRNNKGPAPTPQDEGQTAQG